MKEVDVPPSVKDSPTAVEVLRVWAEPGQPQRFAANGPVWDDPAAWGLLLADIARFVAGMYSSEDGTPVEQTLDRIFAGLKAEFE